jgi:hypothetical protein
VYQTIEHKKQGGLRGLARGVARRLGPGEGSREAFTFHSPNGDTPLRILKGADRYTVRANGQDYKLFFVCAHPRSGTNWTRNLINLHPKAQCFGEFRFEGIWDGFCDLMRHPWHVAHHMPYRQVAQACLQDSMRALMAACAPLAPDAEWLGDQTPRGLVPLLPGAPHVWVIRDGRDVLVSMTFIRLKQPDAWSVDESLTPRLNEERKAFQKDPEHFTKHPERLLADEAWVRHAALSWGARARHDAEQAERFDGHEWESPLLKMRYEQTHADPEGERARLYTFLGLDPAQARPLSSESKTTPGFGKGDGRDFYRKGAVGDWKNYFVTEQAKQWFNDEAGAELVQMGYERDHRW